MKYCGHCGRPLKDEARFCGFCGRECKSPSERNNPSNMDHKTQKKNSFKRLIAAFVVVAICITCIAAAVIFRHKDQLSPVKNAEEAITQLEKLGKELGYDNALSELTEKSTTTIDGDSYYRLQQNYRGIPVYGRTAVYAVDEKGEALAITGNVVDVDNDISLEPTISAEQATKSIISYFTNNLGNESWSIDRLSDEDLCVYNLGQNSTTRLAYELYVGTYEVIIDANNAEVIHIVSTVASANESQIGYLASDIYQVNGFPVETFRNEESRIFYLLNDSNRGISIQNFNGQLSLEKDTTGNIIAEHFFDDTASYVISEDNIFGNGREANLGYEDGVHLMLNLSKIFDYANENLGFQTDTGRIRAFFNDGYYNGENALGGTLPEPDGTGRSGMISLGTKTGTNDLDVMSHEFGHVMSHTLVRWSMDTLQNQALNEGISDIFGEIIEADFFKWQQPDWIMRGDYIIDVYRNIANPRETGFMATVSDKYTGKSKEHYGHSTIISHSAYLMWNGIDGDNMKKISCEELAKLWYRAMLMMPSDCDFAECRTLVELAGKSMNLSDQQIQCIKEAFDAVGIPDEEAVDYKLNTDSTLCVYGADSELYGNYTIQIMGKRLTNARIKDPNKEELGLPLYIVGLMEALFPEYSDSIEVSAAEAVKLNLPVGTYTITLQDNLKSGRSYTFKVSVSSAGGLDNLDIYTDFGKVRLLRQADTYVNGILDSVTDFRYNEKGLITEVTNHYFGEKNSESCVTYVYDDENRMIESSEYKGSEKKWQKTSQYTYDDMGRLARYDYKAAPEWWGTTTYEYDAQGKLIRIKLESGKGNETAKSEILPDKDGHLVRHKVYIDNGKSYEVYDEYRSEVIHDGEYEPFTIYELILVQTGERGNGVTAALEDVMGIEICSFPSYSGDPELITDDEGYLVRIGGAPRYSWDFEFTYLFHYDGDEALGRPPEEILDSSG